MNLGWNEVSHNWRVLGKLEKIRSVWHITYTVTGVTSAVLWTSGKAVSQSGIWDNSSNLKGRSLILVGHENSHTLDIIPKWHFSLSWDSRIIFNPIKDLSDISPSADFRFKEGDNHSLGSVFVYVSYVGPEADHSAAYPGRKKFSDEGGKAIKGVLLFSRTLLSSIFCYLLLHNFSLFVSFIKFFTVNCIHSDLPFNCLNRLTVYTAFINHFTSLYIVFNLPFGPYLIQRFNRLKC